MLYRGQFKDIKDNTVTVYIKTPGSGVTTIGEDENSDIFFDVDPVEITMDVENTFECFFIRSCEITLYTKKYLGDNLFTGNSREIIVNVWKENECVFAGFLEPNLYSQPYSKTLDKLTLECSDALATLQYYNYANITNPNDYDDRRLNFGEITFAQMLSEALRAIPTMNLQTGQMNNIYYDGSVRLSPDASPDIFSQVKVSELLWMGDDFDDISTEEDCLTDIFTYFDLKIRQIGCDFYIYSLQSIFDSRTINWYPILLPDVYIREDNSYIPAPSYSARPRESLRNTLTNEQIPGNELPETLSDEIETLVLNNKTEFVHYYYVTLPSGVKVKTDKYEIAETSGKNILKIDGVTKTLVQDENGNYVWTELKDVDSKYVNDFYTVSDEVFEDDENPDKKEIDAQ